MHISSSAFGAMQRPLSLGIVLGSLISVVLFVLGIGICLSLTAGAIILTGFTFDALSRAEDYRFYREVPRERNAYFLCRRLKGSWCQRGVAIALLGDEARMWFNHWGYSWYDILPDNAPRCFVQRQFWVYALAFWR